MPRNDGILYVGGFSEPNKTDFVSEDDPNVLKMARDAKDFYTELDTERRDSAFPLAQGFRPARKGDVRVERELRRRRDGAPSRIVHSYGQGGSGFTLSFGCAGDVLGLVREIEAGVSPVPMKSESGSRQA